MSMLRRINDVSFSNRIGTYSRVVAGEQIRPAARVVGRRQGEDAGVYSRAHCYVDRVLDGAATGDEITPVGFHLFFPTSAGSTPTRRQCRA